MVLSDREIIAEQEVYKIITPFVDRKVKEDEAEKLIASYGLSDHGYDMRLGELKAYIHGDMVDEVYKPSNYVLPGRSRALLSTLEYIRVPQHLVAHIYPKSTYARKGLLFTLAAIDAGWEGNLTIAVYNPNHGPITLYGGQGIIQVQFQRVSIARNSYKGLYQKSEGPVEARV